MTTFEELIAKPPKTPKGLHRIVKKLFGLDVPDRRLCPHHQSPMDYLTASFFDQSDMLIWANRGGGKTMLAQGLRI